MVGLGLALVFGVVVFVFVSGGDSSKCHPRLRKVISEKAACSADRSDPATHAAACSVNVADMPFVLP